MRSASEKLAARAGWVRAALLIVWFCASFGVAIFARDLDVVVAGWPLNFWLTAQGGVLVFLAVVMVYAWALNRRDRLCYDLLRLRLRLAIARSVENERLQAMVAQGKAFLPVPTLA